MNYLKIVILALIAVRMNIVFSDDGVIESPFHACQNTLIISKDKFNEDPTKWKKKESDCHKKIQIIDDAKITNFNSLSEGAEYLNIAYKVAQKTISNLERSKRYADCSAICFTGALKCPQSLSDGKEVVNCSERKYEVKSAMDVISTKLRMELLLSSDAPGMTNVDVSNVLKVDKEKLINTNLRDFEIGTPNPVGRNKITEREKKEALRRLDLEREKLEREFKEKKYKYYNEFMSVKMMERFTEHQAKYRTILYEEAPLFAFIDQPVKFTDIDRPVWSDKQIADAFKKLSENAGKVKADVKQSIDNGKLEFSRVKGEALGLWLKSIVPGSKNSNDLLYYIGMKNQVEDVLKDDPSYCAAATKMAKHLENKEMQNMGLVFAASFAGGPISKGASKAVTGVFRVGRALTGLEASALTGFAIGSTYLGDSFRLYNTTMTEVTSGVREASSIEKARTNLEMNVLLTPTIAPAKLKLDHAIKNSNAKKMLESVLGPDDLTKMSNHLTELNVSHEYVDFLGDHHVIKILPTDEKEIPAWLKMAQAIEKKHGVPVYIDPIGPKERGFSGAFVTTKKGEMSILIDAQSALKNPEDVKVILAHEAVHATATKKAITGKASADNNLKMSFRSIDEEALHPALPNQYALFFSVDEVKAYAKQARILATVAKKNTRKLDDASRVNIALESLGTTEHVKKFSKASQDLFVKTESFLRSSESLKEGAITISKKPGKLNTDAYNIIVKVSEKGEEPFYFEIILHDKEFATTGKMKDLNERLITIISEAQKTVSHYEK